MKISIIVTGSLYSYDTNKSNAILFAMHHKYAGVYILPSLIRNLRVVLFTGGVFKVEREQKKHNLKVNFEIINGPMYAIGIKRL